MNCISDIVWYASFKNVLAGKTLIIVVSNVPRKYAILAGYKIVMNQRSVCTRFINPCHSGFVLVSRDLLIPSKPRIWFITITYSVTKILRKIRATTFTENYGKLRVRRMSAWDERTPLPISLGSATRYLFATR